MNTKYDDYSAEALVRAYNESVEVAKSKGLTTYKPVQRFPDDETAKQNLEMIESSIRAAVEVEKTETIVKRKRPTKAVLRAEGEKAVETFGKKTKTKATKKSASKGNTVTKGTEFLEVIEVREGTNREKLALLLIKNVNKSLPISEVCKHVYGKSENPALFNVVNGLIVTLKKKKLPYQVKKEKGKIGLYTTK
jgi:hypothetical protein